MVAENPRIDRGIIKKHLRKGTSGFSTAIFYLMKELHLSYFDIQEMPAPAIFILLDELKEHVEREEKAHKKAARKK